MKAQRGEVTSLRSHSSWVLGACRTRAENFWHHVWGPLGSICCLLVPRNSAHSWPSSSQAAHLIRSQHSYFHISKSPRCAKLCAGCGVCREGGRWDLWTAGRSWIRTDTFSTQFPFGVPVKWVGVGNGERKNYRGTGASICQVRVYARCEAGSALHAFS